MNTVPVTVVVPTKNEEANLDECLSRLKNFQEVIVVDSESTDRTIDIAMSHGVKVINFVWDGKFPKKRNWVLMNCELNAEWVLFLDADEFVSVKFCESLESILRDTVHNGFWLNYEIYFLGKKLKHGIKQRKLALFRSDLGRYEKIEESNWSLLDMEVHEHPIVSGSVGEISVPIEHCDYSGIFKFVNRHCEYARWEASRFESLGNSHVEMLTNRQKFKYKNIEKRWFPVCYFFVTYLVKMGFMDGWAGFQYAFYKAWYFFTIQNIIKERRLGVG
ncbi:glycosyltransferase family 2 protein [Granulosicoccus sp. 3-233]|uniref:glycosyltransferase family 2 protein n=1 Tax=Granulosicoccus sp. 3-233 TaxID=3417969 RepID=UPI003D344D69